MAKRFGVMLDMSRNAVMKPEQIKQFATIIQKMGYNMIQLYTEDTYEIPEEPYFGYLRGRLTQAELKDVIAYCASIGVEMIPCIQTLAHLPSIFRWETYTAVNDTADILLVDEPRTYELIENMIRSVRECFTTEYLHIGMDEAHMLGLGKHLDRYGFENRFEILRRHLEKVIAIAQKYGFRPIMWSDMFFRLANHGVYTVSDPALITDEIVASRPKGVDLVYWDYYKDSKAQYDTMFDAHEKFGCEVWFAGGAWTWHGFASRNSWTIESMTPAMQSCRERNIDNVMVTMWGDDGKECSFYSVLPSLYTIRRHYDGVTDEAQIKREFEDLLGESYDAMMLLDLPIGFGCTKAKDGTPHKYMLYSDPFLGYMDTTVKESKQSAYVALAEKLEAAAATSHYAYLFESHAALCRLMAIKYDLGVRTRAAYREGDRDAIEALIGDYDRVAEGIETFTRAFRKLWYTENKPNGFDVQELRLGGLLLRVRACRERLEAYWRGELSEIPELEEELLPCAPRGYQPGGYTPGINSWKRTASPCVL